jgi:hypothetical protein
VVGGLDRASQITPGLHPGAIIDRRQQSPHRMKASLPTLSGGGPLCRSEQRQLDKQEHLSNANWYGTGR